MAKSMYQTEIIFNLNTRLFLNALEGVTEAQAKERISDHNNPLNWLVAHTIWARYNTCAMLGRPAAKNPFDGLFENFKPFDAAANYGTLANAKTEWNKASELLKEALATVTEEHLAADCPFKSPSGDFSFGGTIAFMAQHESYDIGQIGLLKKYFTKEAMSYK
ncbi:MAG TPA: DinB family protein [Chitinophagaceae bacterium]|nr:DinB family protein [Chitinophagaceae bacterium]